MPRGEQIAKPAERATRLAGFFFSLSVTPLGDEEANMRVVRLVAACVGAATCAWDRPVVPKPPAEAATAETPATALSAADRAALAGAITDAQRWLLPSPGGRDAATGAVVARFTELATSLAQADAGLPAGSIAAARQELEALGGAPPAEQWLEVAALGLVLDGVDAVLQGRIQLVPFDTTTRDARPPARHSANAPNGPRLDRSVP